MKKYVVCRIVDSAPPTAPDNDSSHTPAPCGVQPPVFRALEGLIDRAYGLRTAQAAMSGMVLNRVV
ncbi:MAG TPA: hypothetical protein ENN97_03575 [Phycisphaerales bacterium]|nr:hypothetical protein [Phycisphaerales bacterium]